MARAMNHLRQDLKVVDLAIELLDARIPVSSHNPIFNSLLFFWGKRSALFCCTRQTGLMSRLQNAG